MPRVSRIVIASAVGGRSAQTWKQMAVPSFYVGAGSCACPHRPEACATGRGHRPDRYGPVAQVTGCMDSGGIGVPPVSCRGDRLVATTRGGATSRLSPLLATSLPLTGNYLTALRNPIQNSDGTAYNRAVGRNLPPLLSELPETGHGVLL